MFFMVVTRAITYNALANEHVAQSYFLLPAEYDLLERHNGCRKCRHFYVNHQVNDCPNNFPNPDTYRTLMEEMALQAMASAVIASTYNSPLPLSSTSASSSQSLYTLIPTTFIKEIHSESSNAAAQHIQTSIAAVLPSSS